MSKSYNIIKSFYNLPSAKTKIVNSNVKKDFKPDEKGDIIVVIIWLLEYRIMI